MKEKQERQSKPRIDLTGKKFGKLTPLYYIKGGKWHCKCDCGNECDVLGQRLKRGTTKSCGCYKAERMSEIGKQAIQLDLVGKKFGKLTALEPTDKRQGRSVIWKCQCDCGNIHFASRTNLLGGYVSSCSNCRIKSHGEEKIIAILKENKIDYETEKTFDTCKFPDTKCSARFDFYINNQYLLEFDGIQHFEQKTGGWFSSTDFFNKIKQRDNYKNEWCKKNNIPLIRIPYYQLDNLTICDILLETSQFIVN